ncbi:hypothetical protein K458DRAFT_417109 [Lentithecium fluviatile CBS 122367]|uniref:Methyltransferase n=1 Tax=Lentithecium fluviatile CBS 122367 TaxID=1168545 RepID=A0A6G1J6R1_9PLEO|nr:hypothetical protein K458DRAFT_417109 [Lentithecium fluviatile CBS 122367]
MELDTRGSVRYMDRLELYKTEKPYVSSIEPWNVPGAKSNNLSTTPTEVTIRNMRPVLKDFSIDCQGFQAATMSTAMQEADFYDPKLIEGMYYSECEAFLKQRFGAEKVCFFDNTLRRVDREDSDPFRQLQSIQSLTAAADVHVDQTPASAYRRIRNLFGTEMDKLLEGRFRILNIWRPLFTPLYDHPLALCDYRSTDPSDFIATDMPSPQWIGELYQVAQNPTHEWWFLPAMLDREVLIIKCFDSLAEKQNGSIAKCTPHCSFVWKDTPQGARPRESLEVRALIWSPL